jgi:hypothetical protein
LAFVVLPIEFDRPLMGVVFVMALADPLGTTGWVVAVFLVFPILLAQQPIALARLGVAVLLGGGLS